MLLYKLLQNFSIFFPFITEEIYQNIFGKEKSIHLTKIEELKYNYKDELSFGNMIVDIISSIRGTKTNNNVSLKTPVNKLDIALNDKLLKAIELAEQDFKATLNIVNLNKKMVDIKTYEIKKIELADINNNLF